MTEDEEKRAKEKARKRAYYEAHKPHIIAKVKEWAQANPEKRKANNARHYQRHAVEQRARLARWRAENPELVKAQRIRQRDNQRKNHLRRKFKLTAERYEEMWAKQNGACAICGRAETRKDRGGKVKSLSVDHCHASGRIRALLCDACNGGLARFRDDPVALRRAADYLERP